MSHVLVLYISSLHMPIEIKNRTVVDIVVRTHAFDSYFVQIVPGEYFYGWQPKTGTFMAITWDPSRKLYKCPILKPPAQYMHRAWGYSAKFASATTQYSASQYFSRRILGSNRRIWKQRPHWSLTYIEFHYFSTYLHAIKEALTAVFNKYGIFRRNYLVNNGRHWGC